MRRHSRPPSVQDDHSDSVFVSMTDMMVSFLVIIMLLMAFFASHYAQDDVSRKDYDEVVKKNAAQAEQIKTLQQKISELLKRLAVHDPLEIYNGHAQAVQHQLIARLVEAVRADIARENIVGLQVSAQGDALRFQGTGLFATGQGDLTGNSLKIIHQLGAHVAQMLPCYSMGTRAKVSLDCNPDLVMLETIQVEGHTDSTGNPASNLSLSTRRAISAFNEIAPASSTQAVSPILDYQNLLGQPVLAVAGYGQMRPAVSNETPEGRGANRRIDLRFIMYVPAGKEFIPVTVDDLQRVSTALKLRIQAK